MDYIYRCSKTKQPLNIFQLQKEIKNKYQEEKFFSRINNQKHIYDKNLQPVESVFEYLNNKYILNEQWKCTDFYFTN